MNLNFVKYEPVLLHDPSAFADRLYQDLQGLPWHRPSEWTGIETRLEHEGARICNMLLPPVLRDRIWALRERLKSIFILSEEPWIPWELCRLNGPGARDGGFFLSERFWMTRWAPGVPNRLRFDIRKLALVISGKDQGHYLREEENLLKLFRGTGREIETIPSDFYRVRHALASGNFHGWHFAGHARLKKEPDLECDLVFDDQRSLCPSDLTGSLANMGQSHPLVFMNCCHTARQEKVFSGLTGWPKQCLEAGVSAFVGTYWPIADQSAYQFAETFYNHIFNRCTAGEAAFKSRLRLKEMGNPAWLTYAVYAHPFAAEHGGEDHG